jgi:hypothetical protein
MRNLETWEPSQHLLIDTGKPRKTCVEVAGRRTFRILTSSQQSGIYSKTASITNTQILMNLTSTFSGNGLYDHIVILIR